MLDIDPPSGDRLRPGGAGGVPSGRRWTRLGWRGGQDERRQGRARVRAAGARPGSADAAAATRAIAARAERLDPDLATTAFIRDDRGGKVFLDATRAGGATVVAAYSPRVRPGTPVSFPVGWDDLDNVRPATSRSGPPHACSPGRDVWRELLPGPQQLPAAWSPKDTTSRSPGWRRCTRESAGPGRGGRTRRRTAGPAGSRVIRVCARLPGRLPSVTAMAPIFPFLSPRAVSDSVRLIPGGRAKLLVTDAAQGPECAHDGSDARPGTESAQAQTADGGEARAVYPLLEIRDLSVSFGPVQALDGVGLAVREGEVVALAGRERGRQDHAGALHRR